jgi:hypothetical protein
MGTGSPLPHPKGQLFEFLEPQRRRFWDFPKQRVNVPSTDLGFTRQTSVPAPKRRKHFGNHSCAGSKVSSGPSRRSFLHKSVELGPATRFGDNALPSRFAVRVRFRAALLPQEPGEIDQNFDLLRRQFLANAQKLAWKDRGPWRQ